MLRNVSCFILATVVCAFAVFDDSHGSVVGVIQAEIAAAVERCSVLDVETGILYQWAAFPNKMVVLAREWKNSLRYR